MPWASRVPAILEAVRRNCRRCCAREDAIRRRRSRRSPADFISRANRRSSNRFRRPISRCRRRRTILEGLRVGYRHYNAANGPRAAYPFGFGLSYTTFAYIRLSLNQPNLVATDASWDPAHEQGPAVILSFTVTNRGRRTGVAVPQIYVEFPPAATEPAALLKAFERIELVPGESRRLSVPLGQRAFAVYVPSENRWKVFPGRYRVRVGESSTAVLLSADITARTPTNGLEPR